MQKLVKLTLNKKKILFFFLVKLDRIVKPGKLYQPYRFSFYNHKALLHYIYYLSFISSPKRSPCHLDFRSRTLGLIDFLTRELSNPIIIIIIKSEINKWRNLLYLMCFYYNID